MEKKIFNFTPDWISGFTTSDGSFIISFEKTKNKIPIRPRPIFILTQSVQFLNLFEGLKDFIGVGRIEINRNNVNFKVTSLEDIITKSLPLFDKHSPRGSKLLTYQIFKKVVLMMNDKKHLTLKGLIQIIELSYFMNNKIYFGNNNIKDWNESVATLSMGMDFYWPVVKKNFKNIPKINMEESNSSGRAFNL